MYLACLKLPANLDEAVLEQLGPALDGLNVGYYAGREQEDDDTSQWIMRWIIESYPDVSDFSTRISIWAHAQDLPVSISNDDWFTEEIPEDVDWLAESYKGFEPFSIDPFFIFGSHYQGPKPENEIPLQIDAATAFGSGEHATTAGCLQILAQLKDNGFQPSNALDMGCGSGILAIAAWKLWQCPVIAVDIEEEAIIVSERHKELNHIPSDISCFAGNGFSQENVPQNAPYQLILANILAAPLIGMAEDLSKNLAENGYAVLSGLLKEQAEDVIKAYKDAGLSLEKRLDIDEWSTLLMKKA